MADQLEPPDQDMLDGWNIRWDHDPMAGETQSAELGVDNNLGRRTCMVKWENRFDFAEYALGQSTTYTDGGQTKLSRLMPIAFPGVPWLLATKVTSITPYLQSDWSDGEGAGNVALSGSANGVASFRDAIVKIQYEQVPYELRDDGNTTNELDRYVQYPAGNPEPSAQTLTLPGATFRYTPDPAGDLAGSPLANSVIPFSISKIVPEEKFAVCWHRLPFDDIWTAESNLYQRIYGSSEGDEVPYWGAVNSHEFFGRPTGTVILMDVKPLLRMGITGRRELDLVYVFGYKSTGWNWVYGTLPGNTDSNVAGWYMVSVSGNFNTADTVPDFDSIHCGRDLNELFVVGA